MKKVYYLSSCSTCKRIMKEVALSEDFIRQDIKVDNLTEEQLVELKNKTGSFESLFNRRAQLYRKRNLKDRKLSEKDYKNLILEEYTFLKRPVFIVGEEVFVGNSKKNVKALKQKIQAL